MYYLLKLNILKPIEKKIDKRGEQRDGADVWTRIVTESIENELPHMIKKSVRGAMVTIVRTWLGYPNSNPGQRHQKKPWGHKHLFRQLAKTQGKNQQGVIIRYDRQLVVVVVVSLRKVCKQLFSLQLWINSRSD